MPRSRPCRTADWSWVILPWTIACVSLLRASPAAADAPAVAAEAADFFETRIRPMIFDRCVSCHGPDKQASGLRLDSREAMLEGGLEGPSVVPGDPDASLMVQAVRHIGDYKMPPKGGKLADQALTDVAAWVKMGAPWPVAPAASSASDVDPRASHWSFQRVTDPPLPAVKRTELVSNPVDAFLQAKLEAKGLVPALEVDRRTLLRRATFDLHGLPPTPEEVDAFVSDPSADAYGKVIDRLLSSPRYGERWGRHWLDVARYADTKGYVFVEDRNYPFAYTYRDYVIKAFNDDLPYDRFLTEQLAADLIPSDGDTSRLAAMGFLTVGRRFLNNNEDIIDDRIDAVTRGMLGLTVACARCHDHKYDPIPTADYYSLFGVFASSEEPKELPEIRTQANSAQIDDYRSQRAKLKGTLDAYATELRGKVEGDLRRDLAGYWAASRALDFHRDHPQLDAEGRRRKLPPPRLKLAASRWAEILKATKDAKDSPLAPWHALAALPPAEFAARAPGLLDELARTQPLARALRGVIPPRTLNEAGDRMGAAMVAALQGGPDAAFARAVSDSFGLPAPAPINDAEWEPLRLFLVGEAGPIVTPPGADVRGADRAEREVLKKKQQAVTSLDSTHPGVPAKAMVMVDRPQPVQPHVFLRGNAGRPGKEVPRQFLQVLSGPDRKPFGKGSGRLELAQAIASPDNPLTARVMVNRIWTHHFGAGLVATPSDFGLRSDAPTNPELLDWLASRFVQGGWSVKNLHRIILTSAAYRRSSDGTDAMAAADPMNLLLARQNRRRLDFEGLRDSLLAVAGRLETGVGGRAVPLTVEPFATRRTVYGFIDRQNLDGVFRTFDFASPDASSPRRFVTVVPQQALFLMNSPFVSEQARHLAARLDAEQLTDPGARVDRLYRLGLGRLPETDERDLALRFVQARPGKSPVAGGLSGWEAYAQALLLTNEFSYVD
ncbi:PSD1 and planctomycete cytochrome C domain-containing protein [Isosphaeraceae bacterium EP7]